jgi:hypothetical protein
MSITVKAPSAISAGVPFVIEVRAVPGADFTITIDVSGTGAEFGLERGTTSRPKAKSHDIFVSATAKWTVVDLDIPPGANDFTVTLTEKSGGGSVGRDSGKVL